MTPDDLKKLRKEAGLTQGELAEQLGMGLRAVQDLESGSTPIRLIHELAIKGLGLGQHRLPADELATRMIGHYAEQIDLAERTLRLIDEGMTFHEAAGQGPMRDVTPERREEIKRNIEAYKSARTLWRMALEASSLQMTGEKA